MDKVSRLLQSKINDLYVLVRCFKITIDELNNLRTQYSI